MVVETRRVKIRLDELKNQSSRCS